MNPQILWHNPNVKQCSFCWFCEGRDMRILAEHLLKHHRAFVVQFMGSQGCKSLEEAASKMVDKMKMPRPTVWNEPRLDTLGVRWADIE